MVSSLCGPVSSVSLLARVCSAQLHKSAAVCIDNYRGLITVGCALLFMLVAEPKLGFEGLSGFSCGMLMFW